MEVCDISKLPLESESVDVVVFCLALMGVNYGTFLSEATRVLNIGGILLITEVTSRFQNEQKFKENLQKLGFDIQKTKDIQNYFKFFVCLKKK